MMRELADNILDIAQNSIAAGASLVEIDISVSRAQDTVSLAFIDDGCGMSEDMVKAVCDPFTTTRKTRKVGLGLPLSKSIVERQGGLLSVHVHRIQTGRGDDRARDVRTFSHRQAAHGRRAGRAVYVGADEPDDGFPLRAGL